MNRVRLLQHLFVEFSKSDVNCTNLSFLGMMEVGGAHSEWLTFVSEPVALAILRFFLTDLSS